MKLQTLCFKALYSNQSWAANVKFGAKIPRIQEEPLRSVTKCKFCMTQKKNKLFRNISLLMFLLWSFSSSDLNLFCVMEERGKCHIFEVHSDKQMRFLCVRREQPWGFALCLWRRWTNILTHLRVHQYATAAGWKPYYRRHFVYKFSQASIKVRAKFSWVYLYKCPLMQDHGTAKPKSLKAIPSKGKRLWPRNLASWPDPERKFTTFAEMDGLLILQAN